MLTECKFVPATALDGLAANLATLLEWSRLQDTDGIGFFFITNGEGRPPQFGQCSFPRPPHDAHRRRVGRRAPTNAAAVGVMWRAWERALSELRRTSLSICDEEEADAVGVLQSAPFEESG